ncbi:glycosyltransferase family 4 protein [Tritonibacter scottomollicae]|uniref:glycosyltransferase family 4 protein n=1 Tax=Tritonibacter scottomollicae TaxID=483013 RepID=UPI003AA8EFBB
MSRILINASNLHVGGGVQVAASAISEIVRGLDGDPLLKELTIAVSQEVAGNLSPEVLLAAQASSLVQLDVRGVDAFNSRFNRLVDEHDTVFTIFGPLYRWRTRARSIVGFAQPWIIFPDNEVYDQLPWHEKLRTRLRFWIQKLYYKRADTLVVELQHVKDGLVRELGIEPGRIHVVHNCVSSVYQNEDEWLPLDMPDPQGALALGFVGRNYLHKNTAIFPEIVRLLSEEHGIEARFYVTFTEEEWRACTAEFRAACVNVGPISVGQCPNFYRGVDAVVFPSLLECFSATPLEAMVMGRPLFVSDKPFNRDVCKEHGRYFDPHTPGEVARQIAGAFRAGQPDRSTLDAARDHALTFSSPRHRAEQYLALMNPSSV